MQDRDRSPERASPRGRWNIEWEEEWNEGHYSRGLLRNNYRFSRDGRVVEIQVSNYSTYQTTFICDADDLEKVKDITWSLAINKERTYWCIRHTQNEKNDPRLNGFPRKVLIARYLLNYTGPLKTDHKNRDTLDQRQANLRIVTVRGNNNNKSLQRNNVTGENAICEVNPYYYWQVSYYKPNGRSTTKKLQRDPQDDEIPVSVLEWIREKRAHGYDRALNPYQKTDAEHYQFTWCEDGKTHHEKFELSEQGWEDAKRYRAVVYARIENYNGSEYAIDNEIL